MPPPPETVQCQGDSYVVKYGTLGLELSDTKVYEPKIRDLLGTASHYCEAVVFEWRTVPSGTALGSSATRTPPSSTPPASRAAWARWYNLNPRPYTLDPEPNPEP